MREDTENTVSNDTTISSQNSWLRIVLVSLLTGLLVLGGTWVLGAYDHTEVPSIEEQLSDGKFDSSLLTAKMLDTDLTALSEYVRPVSVNAVRYLSEQEVLDLYNAQVEQILEQINTTYGEDVPEDIQVPEVAESAEDLPQEIKNRFNGEGLFPQQVASRGVNGFLINGKVAIPSRVFQGITVQDNVQVEIKLLADPSVEDQWKEEPLFGGSATELMDNLELHSEVGLAFIARPDNNILTSSDESPYQAKASLEELRPTDTVVYGTSQSVSEASVLRVVADRNILALSGAFSGQEVGMPVFALRDGNLVWAGIIVAVNDSHTAIVAGAETVETRSTR